MFLGSGWELRGGTVQRTSTQKVTWGANVGPKLYSNTANLPWSDCLPAREFLHNGWLGTWQTQKGKVSTIYISKFYTFSFFVLTNITHFQNSHALFRMCISALVKLRVWSCFSLAYTIQNTAHRGLKIILNALAGGGGGCTGAAGSWLYFQMYLGFPEKHHQNPHLESELWQTRWTQGEGKIDNHVCNWDWGSRLQNNKKYIYTYRRK